MYLYARESVCSLLEDVSEGGTVAVLHVVWKELLCLFEQFSHFFAEYILH
jgi:hypothetical protein